MEDRRPIKIHVDQKKKKKNDTDFRSEELMNIMGDNRVK